jgi:anaerobic selenocysteine-containing dehydrogenase
MSTEFVTCPFCEAMCGVTVDVEKGVLSNIRGDPLDPLSRGFLCSKALALKDVYEDADRLRQPVKRHSEKWVAVTWEEALKEVVDRLHEIQATNGRSSVAFYSGNPNLHSYTAQLAEVEFRRSLRSHAVYSTASVDHLPHLFVSYHLFGHQLLVPVPDLDRTDFLLIIGANPAESNGSLMGAPGIARRFREMRARGARIVVIDPRRTRTAELADRHHYIVPGTDALLLAAMLHTLAEEKPLNLGRLNGFTRGVDEVGRAMTPYTPERVAGVTGIRADVIRDIAREFRAARAAACYTRVGACTQEFGALTCWMALVLNVATGNLDREGGVMFSKPAVDIVRLAGLLGRKGSYGSWHSRVRHLPEFGGELTLATLAEDIDTPGEGRIRALVTSAGNPVLSTPNGMRLDRALSSLEYMVSIDFYVNETTRHANLILPPVFVLERDHYDLANRAFGVRNTSRYTGALFAPGLDRKTDWDIYLGLAERLWMGRGGLRGRLTSLYIKALHRLGPQRLLDALLRFGPHRLSLTRLRRELHALDLGPLTSCLPGRLYTRDKKINLAPPVLLADLGRLSERLSRKAEQGTLALIGRRQIRNKNSWLHNAPRLMKGADRCTLLMNPSDAQERGLHGGQYVEIKSSAGKVTAPLELCDGIMPGVVSLPHGFGHSRPGTLQSVAKSHPGVSINDLTDGANVDALTGTACFSATPVQISATGSVRETRDASELRLEGTSATGGGLSGTLSNRR